MHRYRDGHTAIPGQLDDYAFMIFGLLEVYGATLDARYLETALRYNDILSLNFADQEGGGYYMTSSNAEVLIVRPKSIYDGAIPSGNSVQMYNLLRLARLTGRFELEQQAGDTGRAFGGVIQRSPSAYAQTLLAFLFGASKGVEVVVVGRSDDAETQAMLNCINEAYDPSRTVLFKDVSDSTTVDRIAPFVRDMAMVDGKSTAYICRNFSCEQPINSLDVLQERLGEIGRR